MAIEIPLTRGLVALIDEDDEELVCRYKWKASVDRYGRAYATRTINYREGGRKRATSVSLGRVLLSAPSHLVVDYINNDSLDNRRSNIRLATRNQDGQNRPIRRKENRKAPYKGIAYIERYRAWQVTIVKDGKRYYVGLRKTPEEAAAAYNEAAIKYHGEFACLNIIDIPLEVATDIETNQDE